ncbi:MAG: hydrogenase nickel incorporation protein HypB [Clostridiales Family XIII bacterium]|jgi:hydrogenase nickel incorporation protein HypB|nr:hydrogenase nickel incorporation protein HypB [Clostridiales Family XIII bacterium]
MSTKVDIYENVLNQNERLAGEFNQKLSGDGVFFINILWSPGAGKTTCLLNLIPLLPQQSFVIEGDIESDIDTVKMRDSGIPAVQINTEGACHLETPQITSILPEFKEGFLFVENIGNLVCPAEFLIGEHIKLLIPTVVEGSDKPYKYPLAFEKADLILLNKIDLLPYVDFDIDYFSAGVRRLNPDAPILQVCGKTGQGFREAAEWILERSGKKYL